MNSLHKVGAVNGRSNKGKIMDQIEDKILLFKNPELAQRFFNSSMTYFIFFS